MNAYYILFSGFSVSMKKHFYIVFHRTVNNFECFFFLKKIVKETKILKIVPSLSLELSSSEIFMNIVLSMGKNFFTQGSPSESLGENFKLNIFIFHFQILISF